MGSARVHAIIGAAPGTGPGVSGGPKEPMGGTFGPNRTGSGSPAIGKTDVGGRRHARSD